MVMFSDEEDWEDGQTVQERIKERENRRAQRKNVQIGTIRNPVTGSEYPVMGRRIGRTDLE